MSAAEALHILESQQKPRRASFKEKRTFSSRGSSRFSYISPRRCASLTIVFLVSFLGFLLVASMSLKQVSRTILWDQQRTRLPPTRPEPIVESQPEYMHLENFLAGPPTVHFRDALRNDTKYLTSWYGAGFNNDVMTVGNMIYLAMLTDRIPVLPPLTSYISGSAPPLPFSDLFNITHLMHKLQRPVLEWHQLKDWPLSHELDEPDKLGCWSIWEVANVWSDSPRGSYTPTLLNLDISYTRPPSWVKLIPGYEHDSHSPFWALARLAFPQTRTAILADPNEHPTHPSEWTGTVLPPDEQLICYDYLYYACGMMPSEYDWDYSPAWRFVLTHSRWTDQLQALAQWYLRHTLNVPEGEPIPPYITMHARRGDFIGMCGNTPRDDCFPPLSAFARRVAEIRDELRRRHGIEARHVIMTSDERDAAWWEGVAAQGWLRVDHDGVKTAETYGNWYPVIVDAVIQSGGMGFVGTDTSTFSIMARRRVDEWNNGAVRTVKWGRPGADAH